jgi:shikimate dehydrogenase
MPDKSFNKKGERLFGLIGYPLSHSFSKKFFTEKFEKEGITDCRYEQFPIDRIDLFSSVLQQNPSLEGLNVTIPYKEKVLRYLDQKDELVNKIGACNCIRVRNGQTMGFNTDAYGFEKSLLEKLKSSHQKALIFGTGGAAKAVKYVLGKLNIPFRMVSRKPGAEVLSYEQVTPDLLQEYTLLINSTPLGMYPAVTEAVPIPYEAIGTQHYLYDLIYNPPVSLFLQKGAEQGASTKNGQDMLILQAEESWRIWNMAD